MSLSFNSSIKGWTGCSWHPNMRYTLIKTFGGPGPNYYACKGEKKKKK